MKEKRSEGDFLILLMRSVLTGSKLEDNLEHNWEGLYRLAHHHQVVPIIYDAIKQNHLSVPKEVEKRFHEDYWKAVSRDVVFQNELETIQKEFLKQGMSLLPFKGMIVKSYYPQTWYRSMADIDILIDPMNRDKVKECMEKLGYEVKVFGREGHDVYYKPPVLNIEIHSRLFEKGSPVFQKFFSKAENAVKREKAEITYLSKEDTCLYLLCHMVKHMKYGGAGIRQVIDIWLYLEKEEQSLDWQYIQAALKELGLEKFEDNIRKLGSWWMTGKTENRKQMRFLTGFLLQSGVYGTQEVSLLNGMSKRLSQGENLKAGKLRTVCALFFPSWKNLCASYPILKKFPFLIVAVQIKRAFKFLFLGKSRKYVKIVTGVSEEKVEHFEKYMDEFGI